MAKFEALELALELAAALGKLLPHIQKHDRDMVGQLKRAGTSAPACLSEGAQRAGKDRLQMYRTSGGSAAEIRTHVQVAIAWGYVTTEAAADTLNLADRLVAMTWRLCHPKRS